MATPSPSNRDDVSRWASAITLGLSSEVTDSFNTKPYFASGDHRIFYASVFNQTTAYQIQKYTPFHWRCCIAANDLLNVTTGAALVALVATHLVPATPGTRSVRTRSRKLWFVKAPASRGTR